MRFVFRIVRSLWNLAGTSAALLPKCLSNFKAIRQFKVPISWLRDFTRSYEKTSFRILRWGPGCHFKTAMFNLVLLIGIFTSSNDNALRWMPWDLAGDTSTLVQVMAWCRQATSHYPSQCWPSSMSPYGVTRPQRVKPFIFSYPKYLLIETHPKCIPLISYLNLSCNSTTSCINDPMLYHTQKWSQLCHQRTVFNTVYTFSKFLYHKHQGGGGEKIYSGYRSNVLTDLSYLVSKLVYMGPPMLSIYRWLSARLW